MANLQIEKAEYLGLNNDGKWAYEVTDQNRKTHNIQYDPLLWGARKGNTEGHRGVLNALSNKGPFDTDFQTKVYEHAFMNMPGRFADRRGFFGRVAGPIIKGGPAQLLGLPADVAQLPLAAVSAATEGVGWLSERYGELRGGATAPADTSAVQDPIKAAQEGLATIGSENLRQAFENATGIDMTADPRGPYEQIMAYAMEFALGGAESKFWVETAGALNTLSRMARKASRERGADAVSSENVENMMDRVKAAYRGKEGRQRFYAETGYGFGAGFTFGSLLEGFGLEDHPLGQVASMAGAIAGPAALVTGGKYLADKPVINWLSLGIVPAAVGLKRSLGRTFVGEEALKERLLNALKGYGDHKVLPDGSPNTRKNRGHAIARLAELQKQAMARGGAFVEGTEDLFFSSPARYRGIARALTEKKLLLEKSLRDLEKQRRIEGPDAMPEEVYARERENLEFDIAQTESDIELSDFFGQALENIKASTLKKTGRSAEALAELTKRDLEEVVHISDNLFSAVYKAFDDSIEGTTLGGEKLAPRTAEGGVDVRGLLDEDYNKFKDAPRDYVPKYEETRQRLLREGIREGSKWQELKFVDEETIQSIENRLTTHFDQILERDFLEARQDLLRSAEKRQSTIIENLDSWVREKGYDSIEEAAKDPALKLVIDEQIRSAYADADDPWKALQTAFWERIPGLKEKVRGETIKFPENTVFQAPGVDNTKVDVSGLGPAEAIDKITKELSSAAGVDPALYLPRQFFQIGGTNSARNLAKSIQDEQILAAQVDSGLGAGKVAEEQIPTKIAKLEENVAAAQDKLNIAETDFAARQELEREQVDTAVTDLKSFVRDMVQSGARGGANELAQAGLLRYLSNSVPETARWSSLKGPKAVADRKSWLESIPQRIGDEVGIPEVRSRQPLELSEDNATMLGNILGDYRADKVISGELSLEDAVGGVMRTLAPPKYVGSGGTWKTPTNYLEALIEKRTTLDNLIEEPSPTILALTKKRDNLKKDLLKKEYKLNAALESILSQEGGPVLLGRLDGDTSAGDVQDIISELKESRSINKDTWTQAKKANTRALEEMLQSLINEGNFPEIDTVALMQARQATRAYYHVQDSMGDILSLDGSTPSISPERVAQTVLPGKTISDPAAQREAIRRLQTVLQRVDTDIATFERVPLLDRSGKPLLDSRGRPRTIQQATIQPDLPFNNDTKDLYSLEGWPYEVQEIGQERRAFGLRLKDDIKNVEGTAATRDAADLIEYVLIDQLRRSLPEEVYLSGATKVHRDMVPVDLLNEFMETHADGINFLKRHGNKEQRTLVEALEGAPVIDKASGEMTGRTLGLSTLSEFVEELMKANDLNALEAINRLRGRGAFADELSNEAILHARKILKNDDFEVQTLKEAYGAEYGTVIDSLLDNISRPGSKTPDTDIDNFLSVLKDSKLQRDAFKGALMQSVWRKIQTAVEIPGEILPPGAMRRLGKPVKSLGEANELAKLLDNENFVTLIHKTYADNPEHGAKLLEALDLVVKGIGDVSSGRVRNLQDMADFAQKELWTNTGRATALGAAKATGFINELYAAGAGGRIFRRLGEALTGNVLDDMLILAAKNENVLLNFMEDISGSRVKQKMRSDILGTLYTLVMNDLNPLDMFRRSVGRGGAGLELLTEPVEEREDRESIRQLRFGSPTASLQMEPSPVQVARAEPNRASVLSKSLFDYASPALSNNMASAQTDPATLEQGQRLFGATDTIFRANKGGIVSLRKKPRQMVL